MNYITVCILKSKKFRGHSASICYDWLITVVMCEILRYFQTQFSVIFTSNHVWNWNNFSRWKKFWNYFKIIFGDTTL